jgi:hypothetical protein
MRRRRPAAADATAELSWLCAATAARRAHTAERALTLTEQIGWDVLREQLASRRLLTLLGPRLIALAEPPEDSEFAGALEAALAESRRHGAALLTVAGLIRERLGSAGIRSAELKGPGASAALYGDHGRRASRDLDLLVAAEHLERAIEIAGTLGYAGLGEDTPVGGLPLLHATMGDPLGRLPPLELHWRIHWYERRFASERLLASTSASESWQPAAADQLVALLLYFARDGFMNVRHAVDLGAFWDRRGDSLPEHALARCLREWPELRPVLGAAARVSERVVGIPAGALIARHDALPLGARVAVSLARPRPRRSEPQIHAEMALSDGLLTPRGQRRDFIRRQLLAPRDGRRKPDRTGARRTGVAAHCLRSLGRYALALGRIPFAAALAASPAAGRR